MYEAFYGFKEKPFTLTPDPRYFYPSRAHREALDHLLYGIREREGFIVITGDVGTGKTTLCRAILAQLEEGTTTAVILNPVLSEDELLRAMLHDFGLTGAGRTKNELVAELNEFLLRTITAGKRAVLIVDEAQNLSRDLLEQIRLLSNLETERDKLIQIVLVGQLGLLKHLASPELKQLNQRVSVRYRLEPLSYQETCQYIYHRLMVAGGTTGVSLGSGALRAIYRFSQGYPRLINLAADRMLLQGFIVQSREITRQIALAGIKSVEESQTSRRASPTFVRRALMTAAVAGLIVAAAAAVFFAEPGTWLRAAAPAAATSPATPEAQAGRPFTVLVGTFATEPEARAVERSLTGRGFAATVARRSGDQGNASYMVLVGRYQKLADAQAARDGLAAADGAFAPARIVRTIDSSAGTDVETGSPAAPKPQNDGGSSPEPGSTP